MKSVIVLGMHRSGTSAITGAIGSLGAELGPPKRLQHHWENFALRVFNERLLSLGNGSWDAPPPREWLDQPAVRSLLPEARELVAEQFGDAETVVWKDPRTCVTLPFWREVFDEDPVFVLIYRHPSEVAASLTSRNSFGPGHAYAIWERYNGDALRYAAGSPTVVIEYGDLVTDPVRALQVIADTCAESGLVLPNDPASAEHGLVAHERHHLSDNPDELADIATASQVELFAMLRSVQGAHAKLQLASPPPPALALSTELLAIAAELRVLKRQRKAEREQARAGTAAKPGRRQARRQKGGPAQAAIRPGDDDDDDEPIEAPTPSAPSPYAPRVSQDGPVETERDRAE